MSEEKILQDELMNEEELENVAGGNMQELYGDRENLLKLNLYDHWSRSMMRNLEASFVNIGNKIGHKVSFNYEMDKGNGYYIDGKSCSREDFWKFIEEKVNNK